jgi:hypothetical protein
MSIYVELDDGFAPSERLRALEGDVALSSAFCSWVCELCAVEANELFDAYRELYFEGGLSSVYLWDLDGGFAGCFLIKKGKRE